jgi:arylsulfatase A-like enzyme
MVPGTGEETATGRRPTRMGFGSILAWACWIGFVSGTMELAIFLLKCRVLDPRNVNVSRQMTWMFPASGLIVVGGVGVVLAVASRLVPRLAAPRLVLFSLAGVAFVGVLFRAPIFTAVCLLLAAGLAWRASSFLSKHFVRLDRPIRLGVFVPPGLLALTIAASLGREAWNARAEAVPSTSGPARENVILIVLDTVRADRMGVYGHDRDTTPNLARLASRGVRFEQAFSTAPWTAPSHASLFTGRWPHELSIGWDRPLDSTCETLAGVLAGEGYATAGFVANTTYCSYETGLDRGFQHYEDYDVTLRGVLLCSSLVERALNFVHKHPELASRLGLSETSVGDRKDAARINRDFLRWVDGRGAPDRPFFAFLNYYDAHHPYLSPDPEAGAPFGSKPASPRDFRLLKTWWERDKLGIRPEDLGLARDSYDRCIAYLDDQLGRLFDELTRRGELERSIVIVTSDHGEHLGERDLYGHGCSVYRPELHVPLLVVAPGLGREGRVVEHPVSLRDVPATVFDLLKLPGPSPFPGRSLANLWLGGDGDPSDLILSEIESPPDDDPNRGRSPASRGPMTSAVDAKYHYIRAGDGREELFDLRRDPGDRDDLAGRPELAEVLEKFRAGLRK